MVTLRTTVHVPLYLPSSWCTVPQNTRKQKMPPLTLSHNMLLFFCQVSVVTWFSFSAVSIECLTDTDLKKNVAVITSRKKA